MVERFHIDEAGRHIAAHPEVNERPKLDGPFSDGGYTWSFDVKVRRPSRGYQNGVQPLERVCLYFPTAYPFQAPIILLRPDFCRDLPHINPSWDVNSAFIEPCVIDELPSTFVRWNGLTAYLDRLVAWLDDAAHDTLRARDGKWEPMRRDGGRNRLFAPVNTLRQLVQDKARHQFLLGRFFMRRRIWNMVAIGATNGISLEEVVGRTKDSPECIPAVVAWSAKGQPFDRLWPDRLMTLAELRQIAANFGCSTLDSGLQRVAEEFGAQSPEFTDLVVILAVRRPQPLQGAYPSSDIELLPYLVDAKLTKLSVGRWAFALDDASRVIPMPLHDMPSIELSERLTGFSFPARRRAAILGCGSLGSKLAMHLGKAGVDRPVLIDSAPLLPHNLTRMGVVFDPRLSGHSKVTAVAYDLACLGVDADPQEVNVIETLTTGGTLALPADTVVAIDTTASPNVHDALCHHVEGAEPARLVQAAFLAGGRLGYFRVEGKGRSPDLEDLETATWRHWMLHPPEVGEIRGLTPVDVGQGCTSATMVMSDMAASLLAAGMARQASDLLAGDLPAVGRLSTAVVGTDGASVRWAHLDQAPSIRVPCNDGWSIHLLPQLHDEITTQARGAGANETGGYLLARVNWVLRRITIAAQFPAPPDSICTPTLFVLGIEGAKDGLDDMVVRSMNGLIPIGTWHSHPRGGGVSQTDLKTLRDIARDLIRLPALGLIWRPDGYSARVKEGA